VGSGASWSSAAAQARAFGAEAIALWSRPYQTGAHRLYRSLGHRRVPERDGEDREGRRWVFRLDLDGSITSPPPWRLGWPR